MTGYEPRRYRELFSAAGMAYFGLIVGETDLQIGIGLGADSPAHTTAELQRDAMQAVVRARGEIEGYILTHPEFLTSLAPVTPRRGAPAIVKWMCDTTALADVGPMAAVAGAIAETVGAGLMERATDVIVENGGDIFIASSRPRRVGIYAGQSPLNGKIALEIAPGRTPCGVCTSSGTVGHSLSFGQCDAAVIVARDTALADAVATRVGNEVKSKDDIEAALGTASSIPGVSGAVIVIGDALGAWGDVELAPA